MEEVHPPSQIVGHLVDQNVCIVEDWSQRFHRDFIGRGQLLQGKPTRKNTLATVGNAEPLQNVLAGQFGVLLLEALDLRPERPCRLRGRPRGSAHGLLGRGVHPFVGQEARQRRANRVGDGVLERSAARTVRVNVEFQRLDQLRREGDVRDVVVNEPPEVLALVIPVGIEDVLGDPIWK